MECVRGGVVTGLERSGLVWGRVEGEAIRELDRGAERDCFEVEGFGVSGADVDGRDVTFAGFVSLYM